MAKQVKNQGTVYSDCDSSHCPNKPSVGCFNRLRNPVKLRIKFKLCWFTA